jgi:hypothetical protein
MKSYIFPDPPDARCVLQPDSMSSPIVGQSDAHPANGAPCQSFDVPPSVPNRNGASLLIEKEGYASYSMHGVLDTTTPTGFICDVFMLQKTGGARPFAHSGRVSLVGRAWTVGGTPWYPLTYSLLWGLGGFMKGGAEKQRVGDNARWMAEHGADAVRTLYEVDWTKQPYGGAIRGSTTALAEFLDWMWGDFGLRTKVTAYAGADGRRMDKIGDEIVGAVAGREEAVLLLEAVNEQYAPSAEDAVRLARLLGRAGMPTAVGWGTAGPDAVRAVTGESGASVSVLHLERTAPAERRDRQCWDFARLPGACDCGEPAGPASSVASEGDPFHLAFQRIGAILMGAGSWCLHTGAMVYGVGYQGPTGYRHANVWEVPRIEEVASAVRNADNVIQHGGVENWPKTNNPIPLEVVSGGINKQYYTISGAGDVLGILTEPGDSLTFRENRLFREWRLFHSVTGERVEPDAALPGYVVRGTLA